jgi:hypothetical protein
MRRYSTVSIKFSIKYSQMQFCLERDKSMRGDNSFLFSPISYNLWNDLSPYIFDLHTKSLMPRGAILGKARVFLHSLTSAPTYRCCNRHTSRALLHFRTGYGFFASIRHTTAELSDQLCSCKSKETRDHILLHCPRYHRARIKSFQALQLSPDDVTLPLAATKKIIIQSLGH